MNQMQSILTEDRIMLQQLEQGNREAFNMLFEKYWEKSFSEAYKRLKNREDAKDIVQEIFSHLWIKRETTHIENLPAYLHVAIRNKVIKFVSKQKLSHPYFDKLDQLTEKNSDADSNILWKEFYRSYEALLNTLPAKRLEIFRLRFEEDLPTKDISFRLGIKQKTVQNQLGKALDTLKVSLTRVFLLILYCTINTF